MTQDYAKHLAAASPLAAAAFQLGQVVSAVDHARAIAAAGPAVHRFDDTTTAYNASQCHDEIKDGDLLVVASERAIAVLMGAYPVALTILNGQFHDGLEESARTIREGRYAASVDVAEEIAAGLGLALDPTHAARPNDGPAAHRFDSTAEAYAAAARKEVADGDVLVVEPERVVAFVVNVLPVALTELHGSLYPYATMGKPSREYSDGLYIRSVDLAETVAAELGFPLAGPAAAAAKGDPGQPTPIEIPRMLVEPGDILHAFGARLTVIDTGIQINPAAAEAQWWAEVEGVTRDDSRRTYPSRWTIGVPVTTAAWDVVTVDRVLSAPTA
ncbi:hypothetical protein ACFXJ6_08105 [Streptomyces sp. NPDC059218]|uniref:hypothetical protein n=1 Tax=unclassified Streptomyces TaxID=2593676 RepID=UPI0036901A49